MKPIALSLALLLGVTLIGCDTSSNYSSSHSSLGTSHTSTLTNPLGLIAIKDENGTAYFDTTPGDFLDRLNELLQKKQTNPSLYTTLSSSSIPTEFQGTNRVVANNTEDFILIIYTDDSQQKISQISLGTNQTTNPLGFSSVADDLGTHGAYIASLLDLTLGLDNAKKMVVNIANSGIIPQNQTDTLFNEIHNQVGYLNATKDGYTLLDFYPLNGTQSVDSTSLSSDPFEFEFALDDSLLTLPTMAENILDIGLSFGEKPSSQLANSATLQTTMQWANAPTVTLTLSNHSGSSASLSKATVTAIQLVQTDATKHNVTLSGGLSFGSTSENVKAVFGRDPDQSSTDSDGSLHWIFLLNPNSKSRYEFVFKNDTATQITMVNEQ